MTVTQAGGSGRHLRLRGTAALLVVIIGLTGCGSAAPTPVPLDEGPVAPPFAPTEQQGSPAIPECVADPQGCAVIPPGETIKIAMGGPMTGDFADFGTDISQAAQLAVADFGEYLGWRFELVIGDTGGMREQAVPLAEAWLADPTVVAVAGHIFSGETQAVMPLYEEAGLPMLSPSATNPDLTRLGSTVFNRVAFTDVIQAEYAASYLLNNLGVRRLAVIHDGDTYGEGLAELVARDFERGGGQVVASFVASPDDPGLTESLASLAEAGAEAIYYGGYDVTAIAIVNELARLREGEEAEEGESGGEEEEAASLPADLIFFGCDGTFGENFRQSTGENGFGAYATSLFPAPTPDRLEFDRRYTAQYGIAPGTLSPYTWHGYDAVGVLIAAVKRVAIVGRDGSLYVPRGALVGMVRGVSDYPGLTGEITCDQLGECSTTGPQFYVLEAEGWIPAPEAVSP